MEARKFDPRPDGTCAICGADAYNLTGVQKGDRFYDTYECPECSILITYVGSVEGDTYAETTMYQIIIEPSIGTTF